MSLTKVTARMTQANNVNVFDYMTQAQINDVKANTASVDVTVAVQSAVNSQKTVVFPAGTYLISSTITTTNASLVGENAYVESVLKYTATDGSACLEVTGYYNNGYYTQIRNLSFLGNYTNGSATTCTAVYLYNNTDEDIDAYIDNCFFTGFRKSIHIKGRGLTVQESVFTVTLDAFYLDRVIPVNAGTNPDQKTNSGARVYQFYNNRFHAMADGSIISNTEATNSSKQYLRGIHFADNYIDTTARIMNGPCRESSFIGNMHIYPSATQTLFFSNAGDWIDINICDNIFTSWRTVGGGATAVSNQRIMYQQDNISGLIFSNNNIYNVDEDVIEVGGNLTDGVITGNSFTNVILNASASAYRPVDIGGDAYRLQFNNNTIEVDGTPANADYIVNITGSATSVDCSNNAYNVSAFDELANKGSYINVQRKIDFKNAAPTSGTWVRGDLIYNVSPSAGGTIGWVCVTAGTPGTWKTFGAITI